MKKLLLSAMVCGGFLLMGTQVQAQSAEKQAKFKAEVAAKIDAKAKSKDEINFSSKDAEPVKTNNATFKLKEKESATPKLKKRENGTGIQIAEIKAKGNATVVTKSKTSANRKNFTIDTEKSAQRVSERKAKNQKKYPQGHFQQKIKERRSTK